MLVPLLIVLGSLAFNAQASHFRYVTLSWTLSTNSPGEVVFNLTASFRRSTYLGSAPDGRPQIGDVITESNGGTALNFGDGAVTPTLQFVITAFSPTENWIVGRALQPGTTLEGVPHTYTSAGPFAAGISGCCRIVNLNNGANGNYTARTLVTPLGTNQPPVTSLVPIVTVSRGSNATFQVPASDPEGDTLRWRLATTAESGISPSVPPNLQINPTNGVVTWNNLGLDTINFWTTQVIIEDLDPQGVVKSRTPVDFLLKINPNPPPTCQISATSPLTALVGSSVNFAVTASHSDPTDVVTLNTGGLPAGAMTIPTLPASGSGGVTSLFAWTPTPADVGPHVIQYSATEQAGAQSLCSITINVTTNLPANQPPVARCKDVTVPADANCKAIATVDNGSSDPDGDPITLTQTPAGPYSLGTNLVTLTVTDNKGASNSCTATVTVVDITPPSIACVSGATAPADANCQAPLPNLLNFAADNCTPSGSLVITQIPAVGTPLGLGTHGVIITAVDAAGNSNSCQTTFTVVDGTLPVIACLPAVIVSPITNCQAEVPNLLAMAADNCTPNANLIITQTPPAGTVVGLGAHTVAITVRDGSGNSNSCQTTFTVVDSTPPTITCLAGISVSPTTNCQAAVPNLLATATDNCTDSTNLIITQIPPIGTLVGAGPHAVTLIAVDASGNSNQCQTTFTVVDSTPPTVTCLPGVSVSPLTNCQAAVPNLLATATDNCTDSTNLVITQTPTVGTMVGTGLHTVTITAVDEAGNSNQCQTTFTVMDSTPPTITCLPNVTVSPTNNCMAAVPSLLATATDNCTLSDALVITQVPSVGTLVGFGTHVIMVTATDAAGNSSSCQTTFTVADTTPPEITCLPGATASPTTNCTVAMPNLLAAATDNCTASANLVITQTPAVGTMVGTGTHTVTISAVDAAGNSNHCQTTFTVTDSTPPTITCLPDATASATTNCAAAVPNLLAAATDNCTESTNLRIMQVPSVGTLVGLGTHTVVLTATDAAGNSNTCQTTFTVVDRTAPTIACQSGVRVSATTNCQAAVPDLLAMAADNCTASTNLVITQMPPVGTMVGPGMHTVMLTATDASGNSNSCQTTFTVVDSTPPTITCLAGVTVSAPTNCQAAVPSLLATATDNCTASTSLIITQMPPVGTVVGLGTHTVLVTATDAAGNSNSCQTTFTVVDATPPAITCLPGVMASPTTNCQATVPNLLAMATDNCTAVPNLIIKQTPQVGALVGLGTHTVTLTAVDAAGNSNSCQTTFTVMDTTPPTIVCPANVIIPCGSDPKAPITFEVRATDNCTVNPTVVCTPPSGSTFPLGTTTVLCIATDAAGNSSHCSFTITRLPLQFNGFMAPINGADGTGGTFARPLRMVRLGSTIPLKFMAFCNGKPVLTGMHRLQATKFTSPTNPGPTIDVTSTDAPTKDPNFRRTGMEWHYNVNTKVGFSVGTWKLVATLSDGSQHFVWVSVRN